MSSTRTTTTKHRWRGIALAVVAAVLVLPTAAPAEPLVTCGEGDAVCLSYDATLTSQAGDALQTTVSFANTSPDHETNKEVWAETFAATLLSSTANPATVTPSAELPNGLIVMGGGACTSPTFANCAGGQGDLLVDVSGMPGGVDNGRHEGRLGITRVVNVNPPADGAYSHYIATVTMCVDSEMFGECFLTGTSDVELTVAKGGNAAALATLEFPARYAGELALGHPKAKVSYDAVLENLTLTVPGDASKVWDGTAEVAGDTHRVVSMPSGCGTAAAPATLKTALGSVTAQKSITVAGCPTAAFSAAPDGFVGRFDASTAVASVAGRTLSKYRWNFGDGSSKVTTSPTVSHRYDTPGNHTVTLVVEDSEGARSAAVKRVIAGTTTTVGAVAKYRGAIDVAGRVSPDRDAKTVRLSLDRKQGGTFRTLATKAVTLDGASTYASTFTRPAAGTCRLRTTYAGDASYLGSRGTKTFSC